MKDQFYPQIDTASIELMIQLQKEDPDYILGGSYGPEIEALFLGLGQEKAPREEVTVTDKWEKLEQESRDLFEALTEAGRDLGNRDNAEKMAYFRTATSLLERIVGIQERALNLKRLAQFQQTVLNIMDDVLDGDQRAAVRERLVSASRGE